MWAWLACTTGLVETPRETAEPVAGGVDTEVEHVGDPVDTGWEAWPLCLNELMPDNQSVLVEDVGTTPDWIELRHEGEEPLALDGWWLTDDLEDGEEGGSPLDGLVIDPDGFLLLYADGVPEAGPQHLGFGMAADGGEVALVAPDGQAQVVLYGAVEGDFSIARMPDCCVGELDCLEHTFRGTPGALNDPPEPLELEVLSAGSSWSYWDDAEPPVGGWRAADYDDSTWSVGPGPLGFGDAHQVTLIDEGSADARSTVYFRTSFTGLDAVGLRMDVMLDDGAVVWLNGEEAARINLPEGDVDHATLATTAIGDAAESTYASYQLDPSLVQVGANQLAVEVHQASLTSSDLTWDAAVVLEVYE